MKTTVFRDVPPCIFQSSPQVRPLTLRLHLPTHSTASQKTVVIFILSGMRTSHLSFLYTSVKSLCEGNQKADFMIEKLLVLFGYGADNGSCL
jgi:hypothetical protein